MKVLVTAASRQGSTREIADAIGHALESHGVAVTVAPPDQITDIAGYDAFVIGSAIYVGHWLEDATDFVDRFGPTLSKGAVWLFTSGPVGDPGRRLVRKMTADPVELPKLLTLTNAHEHRIFAGKLDSKGLRGTRRLSLAILRGFEGDWRDWSAIESWTVEIASRLAATREAKPERVRQ